MNLHNLKPWPKGVSGNPSGKKKLPEDLRAIDSLTQLEVTKLISKYARMSHKQMATILEDKLAPVLELCFCSIFLNSLEKGDFTRISFLLDRAIGKVSEIVEDEIDPNREKISKISTRELLSLMQANLPEEK